MKKRVQILFGIVIILIVLLFIFDNPFEDNFAPKEVLFFPHLQKADITQIDIAYFISGVRLARVSKDNWQVSSFKTALAEKVELDSGTIPGESLPPQKADQNKVNKLLDILLDLQKGTPVSTNPDKQGVMELKDIALNVPLYDFAGNKLVKLLVGKQTPGFLTNYVREEGNEIYEVGASIKGLLNLPTESWVEKPAPILQ